MAEWIGILSELIWGPWTIALFIGTGVFFSMRLRWMQVTKIRTWMYESVGRYLKKDKSRDLSGLKSVCTLLAATIGTGNLAGVATALAEHHNFMTMRDAVDEKLNLQITERMPERMLVKDTDEGKDIQERIDDLKCLLTAYQTGYIRESGK